MRQNFIDAIDSLELEIQTIPVEKKHIDPLLDKLAKAKNHAENGSMVLALEAITIESKQS